MGCHISSQAERRQTGRRSVCLLCCSDQGFLDERLLGGREFQLQRARPACGRHFLPALLQGIEQLLFAGLLSQFAKLALQKDEAKGVLEAPAFPVLRESFREIQILHAADYVGRITDVVQELARLLGVKALQVLTPFEIPGTRHWVRGAGDFPATQVLATGGEAELLRSIRGQAQHPIGQPFRIDEFPRPLPAADLLPVGIGGIGIVEAFKGCGKARRLVRLKFWRHGLGLIADLRYGDKENMNRFIRNATPPSPEEFQRHLSDFVRQHFQNARGPAMAQNESPEDKPPETKRGGEGFEFKSKPREVKSYLDRFVIKQDDAKKVLSVALCDHYNHVHLALEGKESANYAKQNVILIGPTGVGKTFLIRNAADLIGVPFVKADATKFSETGYVGGDVEDMVRDLVRLAEGDVVRAQYGIIYIDEIDKLAAANNMPGRDVSGRGVQTNLLKLMEETEVPARSPNDIAGQIQAMMEFTQRGRKTPATINTKHILFIVSGAFGGLEKIVKQRLREATIGFAARERPLDAPEEVLAHAQTKDFIDFGFEPEFIGRLPVRVVCHSLNVEDLFLILKNSEASIIRQYEQDFAAYGIEVLFSDDGLRRIAEKAAEEQTGARGLMTVCERVFREIKFELPSANVKRFVVTRDLVENPVAELQKILGDPRQEERLVARQLVDEFARRFQEIHGLELRFTEAAAELIVEEALAQSQTVRDLCATRFKDFQFGLKLIAQNSGQRQFVLDADAVRAPDKVLSDWVVASYRNTAEPLPEPAPKVS